MELFNSKAFGAFSTPVGQLIERATHHAASAGDIVLHLDICDVINKSNSGSKAAVIAIRKRLTGNIRNFHIINLTLTVLETCVKNCDVRFHSKVAQRDFLNDLMKVIADKNNPPTIVKERILGLIQYWAEEFQGEPQLAAFGELYEELKAAGKEFPPSDLNKRVPVGTPPARPINGQMNRTNSPNAEVPGLALCPTTTANPQSYGSYANYPDLSPFFKEVPQSAAALQEELHTASQYNPKQNRQSHTYENLTGLFDYSPGNSNQAIVPSGQEVSETLPPVPNSSSYQPHSYTMSQHPNDMSSPYLPRTMSQPPRLGMQATMPTRPPVPKKPVRASACVVTNSNQPMASHPHAKSQFPKQAFATANSNSSQTHYPLVNKPLKPVSPMSRYFQSPPKKRDFEPIDFTKQNEKPSPHHSPQGQVSNNGRQPSRTSNLPLDVQRRTLAHHSFSTSDISAHLIDLSPKSPPPAMPSTLVTRPGSSEHHTVQGIPTAVRRSSSGNVHSYCNIVPFDDPQQTLNNEQSTFERVKTPGLTRQESSDQMYTFSINSFVQFSNPLRYGVIRWMGSLPGIEGDIAGVEIEDPMKGCTDGTWKMVRYFSCKEGHAFFCPVSTLKPDQRTCTSPTSPLLVSNSFTFGGKQDLDDVQKELSDCKLQLSKKDSLLELTMSKLSAKETELVESKETLAACQAELALQNTEIAALERNLERMQTAHNTEVWKLAPNRVNIEREIGTGGWGAVFEGSMKVAIKRIHPKIMSPHNLTRLQREMKLLAEVCHPNLVHFIGAVFDNRSPPLIVTELLDMNLRQAYEQRQLTPKHRLSIFKDVARALDYLHQRYEPIIHRDVSAPNVLLQRLPNNQWKGKVSDLGSANFLQNAQTMAEGSILYSPPEVIPQASDPHAEAPRQSIKIDVYSYGVLLCEVSTRRLPKAEDYREMILKVQKHQPQMYDLIIRCTKRDPNVRPTMAEVLFELANMQQSPG